MRTAALSKFREWWPEALCAAILIAIAFAGQPDDPLFAIFCAIIGAIFWAMGRRHRALPLHDKLDGIKQDVRQVHDIVASAADEPVADEPRGPRLHLVRSR